MLTNQLPRMILQVGFCFFMVTENLPSIENQHYVFEKPNVHYLFAIHWGIFFMPSRTISKIFHTLC